MNVSRIGPAFRQATTCIEERERSAHEFPDPLPGRQ